MPRRDSEMHHEESLHGKMLALHCRNNFRNGLWIEISAVGEALESVTAIQQLVFRKKYHHLPFTAFTAERIDLHPVGHGTEDELFTYSTELRLLGRFRQRVRQDGPVRVHEALQQRQGSCDSIHGNSAGYVLAQPADVRPRVRSGNDCFNGNSRKAPLRFSYKPGGIS